MRGEQGRKCSSELETLGFVIMHSIKIPILSNAFQQSHLITSLMYYLLESTVGGLSCKATVRSVLPTALCQRCWQGPAQSGREGMGAASKAASGSAVPCTGTPGVGCGAWGEVLAGNRNMASHSQVSTNFELKTG